MDPTQKKPVEQNELHSQDTTTRAPTGSPRTSNRSAAANVANAMPQSGRQICQQHEAVGLLLLLFLFIFNLG